MNTGAIVDGGLLIKECSERFGGQAVVVSIDVKNGGVSWECGKVWFPAEDDDPVEWARECEKLGAGEILLTSIDREGTLEGYDIDLIRQVSQAVNIPVIAHGGCSGYENMLEAIHAGASAVAAGALWTFTEATPKGAAQFLDEQGVRVRLNA